MTNEELAELIEEKQVKEFYQSDKVCHCSQCLEIWISGPEGQEFVKDLWILENEDR